MELPSFFLILKRFIFKPFEKKTENNNQRLKPLIINGGIGRNNYKYNNPPQKKYGKK